MRKLLFVSGLAVALATASGLATPAGASAAGAETRTRHTSIELSGTTLACSGEKVQYSVTLSDVDHVTYDPAGGEHATGHDARVFGTGVGLESGARYLFIGTVQETSTWDSGREFFVEARVDTYRVIAQGTLADSAVTIVHHITRGPDGEVRVEFDNVIHHGCR
jgi:hypothetical protein